MSVFTYAIAQLADDYASENTVARHWTEYCVLEMTKQTTLLVAGGYKRGTRWDYPPIERCLRRALSMHWKVKAKIQNTISHLPSSFSHAMYYWVQRNFGGLRNTNPPFNISRLDAGIETWKRIQKAGCNPAEKVFFEVGTGRAAIVPLAYWLMGAKSTITIDLNPYLKGELVKESLQYMSENTDKVQQTFGSLLNERRLEDLLRFNRNTNFSLEAFLDLCNINYIAPGDATQTGLDPASIDFHTSYTVFEHISTAVLQGIIKEGNRIIRADGLFINKIDYSDHFAHSDSSISLINFLQYSDAQWDKYAGNRYMYMNRLRHDDHVSLFQSAGHHILTIEPTVCPDLLERLRSGELKVNERFMDKSDEDLATTGSWIISKKAD